MSSDLYSRLAVILLTIAIGAALQRSKFLRTDTTPADEEPAFALAQLATYVLVPALLFRTMARLDLAHMPWPVIQAYFVPAMLCCGLVYTGYRLKLVHRRLDAISHQAAAKPVGPTAPAGPATRAMSAMYGNAVQLGIPLSAAMFGEAGLAIHIALVSLHGLILLTSLTLLAEYDLAQSRARSGLLSTLSAMTRNAVLHPVVLPVLLGLGYQLLAPPLPAVVDQALAGLGQAVVPLCLLLIGMNLAHFGLRNTWRPCGAARALQTLGTARRGAGHRTRRLRPARLAAASGGDDGGLACGHQCPHFRPALPHVPGGGDQRGRPVHLGFQRHSPAVDRDLGVDVLMLER